MGILKENFLAHLEGLTSLKEWENNIPDFKSIEDEIAFYEEKLEELENSVKAENIGKKLCGSKDLEYLQGIMCNIKKYQNLIKNSYQYLLKACNDLVQDHKFESENEEIEYYKNKLHSIGIYSQVGFLDQLDQYRAFMKYVKQDAIECLDIEKKRLHSEVDEEERTA